MLHGGTTKSLDQLGQMALSNCMLNSKWQTTSATDDVAGVRVVVGGRLHYSFWSEIFTYHCWNLTGI